MTQHKLSFDSMMAGAPVILPFELVISLAPGYGPYATCEGSGAGVTVRVERAGSVRTEHYPNRVQAWQRASALQGRVSQ